MISQIKKYLPARVKWVGRRVIESCLAPPGILANDDAYPVPVEIPARVEIQEELKQSIEKNNCLVRAAQNTASQNGEDGIIAEILKIIGIKGSNWCVEFGACDGKRDSNSWVLINKNG